MPGPDSTRLSALGADAASALAVVGYFDAFDESAANADILDELPREYMELMHPEV